jgi:hypothetical protein
MNRRTDFRVYLRRHGLSEAAVYKDPEAVAELSRISFLQENSLSARRELRSYIWIVVAAPISAPVFYFISPSFPMLCCSVGFATIVIASCAAQILRLRRTTKDYIRGLERLVAIVRKNA